MSNLGRLFLWPVAEVRLSSTHSAGEVEERLRRIASADGASSGLVAWPGTWLSGAQSVVQGRFRLVVRSYLRIPYLPVIQGQVTGAPSGAMLRLVIRPQLDELAIALVLLILLPYLGFQIQWTVLVLGILHCVGVALSILPAVRWAEEQLPVQLGV